MNLNPAQDKARWKICYDVVSELHPGSIVTYAEIQDRCHCSRSAAQQAMITANKHLMRDSRNTVTVKTNIGWKVLAPNDAVPLIGAQRKKAERADDRHAGRINAAQRRRGELTPERQAEVDHEQRVAIRKAEINGRRRLETRTLAERMAEMESQEPRKIHHASNDRG